MKQPKEKISTTPHALTWHEKEVLSAYLLHYLDTDIAAHSLAMDGSRFRSILVGTLDRFGIETTTQLLALTASHNLAHITNWDAWQEQVDIHRSRLVRDKQIPAPAPTPPPPPRPLLRRAPAPMPPKKVDPLFWCKALGREPHYLPSTVDLGVLTPRELEVFFVLATSDYTIKQAAAHIRNPDDGSPLSPDTIADHLNRIYEKLHLSNRAELCKAGIDARIVSLTEGEELDKLIAACESGRKGKPLLSCHYQVLEQTALGASGKEAGKALGITKSTVKSYKKELYAAFDIHSNTEAARIYFSLKRAAEQRMGAVNINKDAPSHSEIHAIAKLQPSLHDNLPQPDDSHVARLAKASRAQQTRHWR